MIVLTLRPISVDAALSVRGGSAIDYPRIAGFDAWH